MSDKDKSKRPFGSLGQRLFGIRSKDMANTATDETKNASDARESTSSAFSTQPSLGRGQPLASIPQTTTTADQRETTEDVPRTSPLNLKPAGISPFNPLIRLNPLGSSSFNRPGSTSGIGPGGLLDKLDTGSAANRRLQGLTNNSMNNNDNNPSPFGSGNLPESPFSVDRGSAGGKNSGILKGRVVLPEDLSDNSGMDRNSNSQILGGSKAGTLSCMKNTASVAGGKPFDTASGELPSDIAIIDEPTTPFNRELVALTQQIQEVQQRQQQLGQLIQQRRGLTDNGLMGSSGGGGGEGAGAGGHARHYSQQLPSMDSPDSDIPKHNTAMSSGLPTLAAPSGPLKIPAQQGSPNISYVQKGLSTHLAELRQPSIKEEDSLSSANNHHQAERDGAPASPAPPARSTASSIAAAAAARVAGTNQYNKKGDKGDNSTGFPSSPATSGILSPPGSSQPSAATIETRTPSKQSQPQVIPIPSVPPPLPPTPPMLNRTVARELLGAQIDDLHTLSLPGYTVGGQIGEGGFSTVLLGIHNITKRKVAIKVVERARLADPLDEKNMRREIRVMRHLNGHEAVVRMLEVIETRERIYLVLEYAPCDSLLNFVRTHRKMNERDAAHALQQLALGLDFCHQREVVHRDIKLENIMMPKDERGSMKLIDFGLAAFFVPGKRLRANCGSPSYAAPEIVACKEYDGPPVDVWSLGVVLFAMLSGYLPFHASGGNRKELCRKILDGKFTAPETLSSAAKDILSRMLTVDPSRRITLPEVMNHPWVRMNPWIKPQIPGLDQGLILSTYQVRVDLHRGLVYADERILQELEMMGYAKILVLQGLLMGDTDYITSCYHMMVEARVAKVEAQALSSMAMKRRASITGASS